MRLIYSLLWENPESVIKQKSISFHVYGIFGKHLKYLSLSVSMHSRSFRTVFAQFSRYRADTLQVGRGRPGPGRRGG